MPPASVPGTRGPRRSAGAAALGELPGPVCSGLRAGRAAGAADPSAPSLTGRKAGLGFLESAKRDSWFHGSRGLGRGRSLQREPHARMGGQLCPPPTFVRPPLGGRSQAGPCSPCWRGRGCSFGAWSPGVPEGQTWMEHRPPRTRVGAQRPGPQFHMLTPKPGREVVGQQTRLDFRRCRALDDLQQ